MIDIQGNIIPDNVINAIKDEIFDKTIVELGIPYLRRNIGDKNIDVSIINLTNVLLTKGIYKVEYTVFGLPNSGYDEINKDYLIRKMKITDLGIE